MNGYQWTGGDAQRRQEEIDSQLTAIRKEAKKRTGWKEWMTEEVGWGALGDNYVALMERRDAGRW